MELSKKYDLKINPDYYIATANDLILGRQTMTVRESTLLFIAQAQVVAADSDFKTYTTTVSELAEFMQIDTQSLHRDLKDICKSLMQRVVEVQISGDNTHSRKKWKFLHWISSAEYDNGKLTIRLSDDLKPYMLALAERGFYTQSKLGVLCSFKSYYARRLYQLIVCELGATREQKIEWYFTISDLREFFKVEKKQYPRVYDLLKKTIKVAIAELNSSDYVYIWDYAELRSKSRGRGIESVTFRAMLFTNKTEKEMYLTKWKQIIDNYNQNREVNQ